MSEDYTPSPEWLGRKMSHAMPPGIRSGRIPPQDIGVEMSVLGVLLQEPNSLDRISQVLRPEMFYKESHRIIFQAILDLAPSKTYNDLRLVIPHLKRRGELEEVGGQDYVTSLVLKYARTANLERYALKLAEKFMLRELIKLGDGMVARAYDETTDVFQLMDDAGKELKAIEPVASGMEDAGDLVGPVMSDVEKAIKGEIEPIYIGFRDIDSEYAFDVGELVVIAGKSGTGKTTKMVQIAKRIRKRYPKIPVVFNSLEMKGKKVISRDMASTIGVSQQRFRTGRDITQADFAAMHKIAGDYKGIHFVQCWTNDMLAAKVRQVRKHWGLEEDDPVVVMGDYAQIMKGDKSTNREQVVASIGRGAKQMAESENVLYFLGSQINKDAGKGRPTKSNLRESEALGNDADWVIMLYSPWNNEEKNYADGESTKNILEAIFDKVRFGRPGQIVKLMMTDHGLITDLPRWDDHPPSDDFPDPRRIKPKDYSIPSHDEEQLREAADDYNYGSNSNYKPVF